jgi:hypothetical protein
MMTIYHRFAVARKHARPADVRGRHVPIAVVQSFYVRVGTSLQEVPVIFMDSRVSHTQRAEDPFLGEAG